MNTPKFIIIHHSVTPRDLDKDKTEKSIEASHKARGFPLSSMGWHIGYQYIIYSDGEIRQYRSETEEGAHCKENKMNFQSIGICMIGDFSHETPDRLNEMPSSAQLLTLEKTVKAFQAKYKIPDANVAPHRRYALDPATGKPYKDCYGDNLPDNPTELFNQTVNTETDTAFKWLKDNNIVFGPHKATDPITWGEGAVVLYRLAKKLLEWVRTPKS